MKLQNVALIFGLSSFANAGVELILLQNASETPGDYPYAMTPDGNLLAGTSGGIAAVWNAQGQFTTKGPGIIYGVNSNGSVFVGQTEDGRPGIWKNGSNAVPILTTEELGTAYSVTANGLYSAGSLYVESGHLTASRFDHLLQTKTTITFPSNYRSEVYRMTPDGNTVVGEWAPVYLVSKGFQKIGQNEYEDLGSLDGSGYNYTTAYDVSDDGKVIVGISRRQPFRWTRDTGIVDLDISDVFENAVNIAVSGDGRTIVGSSIGEGLGQYTGFVWDEVNGLRGCLKKI